MIDKIISLNLGFCIFCLFFRNISRLGSSRYTSSNTVDGGIDITELALKPEETGRL